MTYIIARFDGARLSHKLENPDVGPYATIAYIIENKTAGAVSIATQISGYDLTETPGYENDGPRIATMASGKFALPHPYPTAIYPVTKEAIGGVIGYIKSIEQADVSAATLSAFFNQKQMTAASIGLDKDHPSFNVGKQLKLNVEKPIIDPEAIRRRRTEVSYGHRRPNNGAAPA